MIDLWSWSVMPGVLALGRGLSPFGWATGAKGGHNDVF